LTRAPEGTAHYRSMTERRVQVTPWAGSAPPSPEELEAVLRCEGLEPHWWANGPGDVYAPHEHPYHKVLFCAEGSITFVVEPGNLKLEIRPGDRMDLPRGTRHSAVVGPRGVRCVEGWRYGSEG
jgi:mannose-6-phosphate isomerase-like protein (cupin superfamily)